MWPVQERGGAEGRKARVGGGTVDTCWITGDRFLLLSG